MSWDLRFSEPIVLPGGRSLATLRDAGTYIMKLPKADQDAREWQAAMHVLIQAADHGGPVFFARIGVMRALLRHEPVVYQPLSKDPKWRRPKRRA